MKKLIALLLSVSMLFCMGVNCFAADTEAASEPMRPTPRYSTISDTGDDAWVEGNWLYCHADVLLDYATDIKITMRFQESNGGGWKTVATFTDGDYSDFFSMDRSIVCRVGYSYKIAVTYDCDLDSPTFYKYVNL